ncbi:MAG: DUF4863 family protein [Nannocystaceae bacterium]|nr:DUF4863 family protein [bacterium]
MSAQRVMDLLPPFLTKVAELDPASARDDAAQAALLAALEEAFPPDGASVRALGEALAAGVADGSICNRGDDDARFSRLAKAGPQTHGLSVDVVSLVGGALEHTHPKGEVTLGFPASEADGAARFDGHPPGWVFMPPGSKHVPTVEGGRMFLIYFLPDGAVTWHPESASSA